MRFKPKKKIKKAKPIKQLKRSKFRGTAEAKKLKQKWMNNLEKLAGNNPIDWNLANMLYDQGLPVQAAYQKLTIGEDMKLKTYKEFISERSIDLSATADVNFVMLDKRFIKFFLRKLYTSIGQYRETKRPKILKQKD